VLAAERVVAALGDAVVSEAAGEIELKGMARPVAIHRVTSLR
jgi:class 3 adenylate cyclase